MATIEIRDTKKYGRTYKFRTLIGTDENGVRQYARTTWKPPEGLSLVKEKKLAEAEAYRWEQEIKNGKSLASGAFSQPRPATCDPSPADDTVPEEETLRDSLPDIFIMSNKDKHYGAVELLNEKIVEKAVETFGGSFYVLPSSVHELILLPGGCEDMTLDGLAEMVASINASDVNESDVLSSHIYYYNAEEKRLEMHR